jgi:hypothetical protein
MAVNGYGKVTKTLRKPSFVYPAKLIVNGQVVADEFPQWNDIVHMKRNLYFEHMRPSNNVVVNNSPIHDTYSDSS